MDSLKPPWGWVEGGGGAISKLLDEVQNWWWYMTENSKFLISKLALYRQCNGKLNQHEGENGQTWSFSDSFSNLQLAKTLLSKRKSVFLAALETSFEWQVPLIRMAETTQTYCQLAAEGVLMNVRGKSATTDIVSNVTNEHSCFEIH